MNEYQKLAVAIATGSVALGGFFIVKAFQSGPPTTQPNWNVGDKLWCSPAGYPSHFTIKARRAGNKIWEYDIWLGDPPTEDWGWHTEVQLLAFPWECSKY